MARIVCPECENLISENADKCVFCGNPINKMFPKKKKKTALIICVIAAVLVIGTVLCALFLVPELRYRKALECYQNEQFEEAEEILVKNKRHKHSQELLQASVYNRALNQFNEKKYAESLQMLEGNEGLPQSEELKDACEYYLAEEALTDQDYDLALEYLKDNSYSGSGELLEKVQIEKERHEKADAAFLSDLESSVLGRMKETGIGTDHIIIVNTELAHVEKYKDAEFYDESLKELAEKYIDALYMQREALSCMTSSEYQIKWGTGLVSRYEVLNELYEQYGFLSDNQEFVGTYVYLLDRVQRELEAVKEIKADLDKQCEERKNIVISGYTLYMAFSNNTEYAYSVRTDFRFYNIGKQVLYDDSSCQLDNIRPGEKFILEVYIGVVDKNEWDYSFDIWVPEVILQ